MARPEKKTVDYFPHQTTHGKTIFILEAKFGNDGYAFWFKLLETLGTKEGMFLDCDDLVEWEYFIARAKVSSEIALDILEVLASVGAIDSTLWDEKVVFCQNFVDGITDAFKRRKEHLPSISGVIACINPSKGAKLQAVTGKGKGKETKVKKTKPISTACEERFNTFWAEFPKKTDRKKSLETFTKLNPSPELFDAILESVKNQASSTEAQFFATADRWLRQEKWTDEIIPNNGGNNGSGNKTGNGRLEIPTGEVDWTEGF